jgi:AraC-like DNA-binding protein
MQKTLMITQFDFFRTKYGEELLVDLILLEDLEEYIKESPVQRLTYYDITIIVEGKGKFLIDSFEHDIHQGMVFFSSPSQIRKWAVDDVPSGYVLIFEPEFLCSFFNDARFVQNLSFFNSTHPHALQLGPDEHHHLISLFQNIQKEIPSFKYNDTHLMRALLYQVLVLLHRKFINVYPFVTKKALNRYVDAFVQLVEEHHRQQRRATYYAEMLHVTSGHLNSLVKKYLRISAKRYILNRNIVEAKRLLQYTEMDIDEIASYLNYESTSFFIRTFREHTQISPLQFRKQLNP